jgi:hypothetical protein
MRRAPILAAILACVLIAGLVVPAGGAVRSGTTIDIGFVTRTGDPFFKGRVKSKAKRCMRNRRVVVYRTRNGRKVARFRAGRSDRRGFWRVDMNRRMRTGGYFAAVRPKPGCLKAKSEQIAVGQKGPGGVARAAASRRP